MAIMYVLHSWLAELPASQLCLAASVLRKTPADQTVDHIDHIEVACEYQISGKRLPSVAIRVTPVPATVWETNWAVQAMLVKLAEMDCHHPAAKLVNCFTARIGHAGPILDEINDQQLVSQLKAKPLLVLGPFELPAQLVKLAQLDQLVTTDQVTHAAGSLDTTNQGTDDQNYYYAFFKDVYAHVDVCCQVVSLMISMCSTRYSLRKTSIVLDNLAATAAGWITMPQFDLDVQQLVWMMKQSMMAQVHECSSRYSVASFVKRMLETRLGSPYGTFAGMLDQAWHHGFVQAALDGGSQYWIDYFASFNGSQTLDRRQRLCAVIAAFRVAKRRDQLDALTKLMYCTAQTGRDDVQLCQSAIDSGILDVLCLVFVVPGWSDHGAIYAVYTCRWLAQYQLEKVLASDLVDTIMTTAAITTAATTAAMFNMLGGLAPHMDNARKADLVRYVSTVLYRPGYSHSRMHDLPRIANILSECAQHNDLARNVLLDTWLRRAVVYMDTSLTVSPDEASKPAWHNYVLYVSSVLVEIQLGSQPGDQAARFHLVKFFDLHSKVPVTVGTLGCVTQLDKMRTRLFRMALELDQPSQPSQPLLSNPPKPPKRHCDQPNQPSQPNQPNPCGSCDQPDQPSKRHCE